MSVMGRAAARLYLRRRLSPDDYFLFAAALFLSGAVGLMYTISDALLGQPRFRLSLVQCAPHALLPHLPRLVLERVEFGALLSLHIQEVRDV